MTSLRSHATGWARIGLKSVAAVSDQVQAPPTGVVILLYHQVGAPRPGAVNLPVSLFEAQMAHLAEGGGACTLETALEMLDGSAPPAQDPVVVTFDDGTADFTENALPVLERYAIPATLYLATRWIDEDRSFWDDGTALSWSALRDALCSDLVEVGSHTHSHVLLDRMAPNEVGADLDRSIDLIGEHLGVEARHFAYPKALRPSVASAEQVRNRFVSAALAGSTANRLGASDPHALARTPIQVADGMRWFRRKAAGGLGLEDRVRERLAHRRYADATR